jgi:hypothetical protein
MTSLQRVKIFAAAVIAVTNAQPDGGGSGPEPSGGARAAIT